MAEMIRREEAVRQVEMALRRVALLHAAMAQTLVEEMGEEAGRRLAEAVIDRYGGWIGRAARRATDEKGLEPTAANFSEDLPALGFERVHLADEPLTREVRDCCLARVWREMGLPELGVIYCRVDQAKFRAYNPALACRHLVHTLGDGAPLCRLSIERDD